MTSPVPGSYIPIGKVPKRGRRASSDDIQRGGDPSIPEVLQSTVPSAILSDAQGNLFQRKLQYRGFESSPVNGEAQGLAVYQNGVRINEVVRRHRQLGLPARIAIDGITIIGANPVFGLNAIGGAAVIVMRDGFNFQGAEFDTRAGSFGRIQGSVALGGSSGPWGVFVAVEGIKDDGFRDFSEAEIKRMYADFGVKTSDGKEFHLNFSGAKNFVGVTAAAPGSCSTSAGSSTFTSPQTTDNEMKMLSFNGSVKVTPIVHRLGRHLLPLVRAERTTTATSPRLRSARVPTATTVVCAEAEEPARRRSRLRIATASRCRSTTSSSLRHHRPHGAERATSYGVSLQGVEKSPAVRATATSSCSVPATTTATSTTAANSELGFFGPQFVVEHLPSRFFLIGGPDDFVPRDLSTKNDYAGVYFTNTIDLTEPPRAHRRRPLQLRAHRDQEQQGFEPRGRRRGVDDAFRQARFLPLQSDGGRDLPALARPDALRQLRGGQPCPDGGRARLRRSGQSVPDRELPYRRPAAEAGRLAHL